MNPSRRTFLKRTSHLIAGAAIGPQIISSGVLALDGKPGANDHIVTDHIGLGARGQELLGRLDESDGGRIQSLTAFWGKLLPIG